MTKGELIEALAMVSNDTVLIVDDGDWGCHRIQGIAIEETPSGTTFGVIDIVSRREDS